MKPEHAEVQKKYRALKTTYDRFFTSPDGQAIWADLEKQFGYKHTPNDATPVSINVSAGQLNVLNYIRQMRIPHAVD